MRRWIRITVAVSTIWGCGPASGDEPVREDATPALAAEDVTIEIETADGAITAAGAKMTLSEDGLRARLAGGVSVETAAPTRLRVSADRLVLHLDTSRVQLEGRVVSRFLVSEEKQP